MTSLNLTKIQNLPINAHQIKEKNILKAGPVQENNQINDKYLDENLHSINI